MIQFLSVLVVIFCITSLISFIYLKNRKTAKVFAVCVSSFAAIGILLGTASLVFFRTDLASQPLSAEFKEWASDTYFLYVKCSSLLALITLALSSVNALTRPKLKYARASFITLSCILQAIAANVYVYFSSNENFDVTNYILLFGLASALISQFSLFWDYIIISKKGVLSDGKKEFKNKKRRRAK